MRSKEYIYSHKFQKKGYSGIIPSVYVGKEEIHKNMQYEVSMIVFRQERKYQNGCHLKTANQNHQIFHVHM